MEQKSKSDLNLTARNLLSIQRIDPCAVAILDKATHAAKYNFDVTAKAWTRTYIEGALFIIQRADKPYFSLIIANRQSLDDMVEPVNPLTKMNSEGHYLFFCKPDNQIYGLWFFSAEDCARLYNLLKKLQEDIKAGKIPTPPKKDEMNYLPESVAPPSESNQLLELLKSTQPTSSAQSNHRENLTRPTSATLEKSDKERFKQKEEEVRETAAPVSEMPVLLQKLMIQEQPKLISKAASTMLTSEDLEKDLLRSAKPKHTQVQDMLTSTSAASLAALSNRSVHGSDGEADPNDVDSTVSSRVVADDSIFTVGSGSTTPPLNKLQNAYIYQDRLSINIGIDQIDDIQDEVKILKQQPAPHAKFEDLCVDDRCEETNRICEMRRSA
ncbi:unnamed protein product [Angiostrongylus costaricensis]|uniref:mRNA_decap_C domain-containing protein n=1 Tax=Angiostrongylus costaricensis TaxID=334426 RepID=A0A158PK82_ANGCS|nr:unnamed protein product [Angiostrongylus costaricensis]